MKEVITPTLQEVQSTQLATREQWQENVATRHGIGVGQSANVLEPVRLYQKGDGVLAYLRQAREGLGVHQRDFEESWPEFKNRFAEGVQRGIVEGYIPPFVQTRVEPALERTGVGLVDTRIIDGMYRGASAFYNVYADQFRMKPTEHPGLRDLNASHELFHKLAGGTFERDPTAPDQIHRHRTGYNNISDREGWASKHLNLDEVVAQQLALGVVTGDFETLDPDRRADGNKGYYVRRKIVASFVDRAQGAIQVRTLTKAAFEDTDPDGGYELRRQLVQEVVAAYGWGAMQKLEALCDYAYSGLGTDADAEERVDPAILDRIHPPQFDDEGNIVQWGRIDIEDVHLDKAAGSRNLS